MGLGESLPPGHPRPGPRVGRRFLLWLRPRTMWQSFTVLTAWAVKPALSQLKAFFLRRWKKTDKKENQRARRKQVLEYLPLRVHKPLHLWQGRHPATDPSGLCDVFALLLSMWGCLGVPRGGGGASGLD